MSLFVPTSEKQSKSSGGKPSTLLTQYTAIVSQEYLQKFDDPYHYHNATLDVYQTSFPLNQPGAIFHAIRDASGLCSVNTDSEGKTLEDLTSQDCNGAHTTKRARHDMKVNVLSPSER